MLRRQSMLELGIKSIILKLFQKIKNNKRSEGQMKLLYSKYLGHELSEAEIAHMKTIAAKIRAGEITEKQIIDQVNNKFFNKP